MATLQMCPPVLLWLRLVEPPAPRTMRQSVTASAGASWAVPTLERGSVWCQQFRRTHRPHGCGRRTGQGEPMHVVEPLVVTCCTLVTKKS